MKTISLGYFGDGPWAHEALRRLLADPGVRVLFVTPRYVNPDPVLTRMAREAGLPVFSYADVNSPDCLEQLRGLNPDLLVSMSYDQILKAPILKLPRLGFINCHAGELPFYRGRNVLNWALINGARRFGITVHYVDEGIDTGAIIIQERVPIKPEDDYASLLKVAHVRCADVLHKAVDLVRRGKAKPKQQSKIHPVGFYCGRRGPGDERLEWGWPTERLHNFVRALVPPGPAARTPWRLGELAVLKTELIKRAPVYICTPGEVVGRSDRGCVVKTGDTTILVTKVADVLSGGALGEPRMPRLRIGERLGRVPEKEAVS